MNGSEKGSKATEQQGNEATRRGARRSRPLQINTRQSQRPAIDDRESTIDNRRSPLPGSTLTVLGTATIALFLLAAIAWAGIEGSKHDFSDQEWSGGDACAACHGTETEPPAAAPLWEANADLNRTFGTPLTQSKEAGMGTIMCLRCHDGTIARDNIATSQQTRFVNKRNPGLYSIGHGSGEHPVGVEYPRVNDEFWPAAVVTGKGRVNLPEGQVECISCHDPHNMFDRPYMLVTSNARSALCLTCHRK